MTTPLRDEDVERVARAQQQHFHGPGYTARGHAETAEDCAPCCEAAEVAVESLAGVPNDKGYRGNADARTYLLVTEVMSLRERLARIASWHSRETAPGGMVGSFCNDCGGTWPCDTNRMASGTYEDPS